MWKTNPVAEQPPLVVRRRIRATAARLFEAWTTPEQLLRWWGPSEVRCTHAEVNLRVGGRFRIDNALSDGHVICITGEFLAIDRPHRLIYTWSTNPASEASERVTVVFEPDGAATEVIVTHERIPDEQTRRGHESGWAGCMDGLDRLMHCGP